MEGGAALSFIYNLDRVFSNDLDFTIEDYQLRSELFDVVEEIAVKLNKKYVCDADPNKIIIKDDKEVILEIDFYPLSAKLFSWEDKGLEYNKKGFSVKTHSLEDIFAEKISNIFQENRSEFKDVFDINKIYDILIDDLDKEKFKIYLHEKLLGKKIYKKIKNDPISLLNDRKVSFRESYASYAIKDSLNFEVQFSEICKIIKIFL